MKFEIDFWILNFLILILYYQQFFKIIKTSSEKLRNFTIFSVISRIITLFILANFLFIFEIFFTLYILDKFRINDKKGRNSQYLNSMGEK